MHMEVSLKDGSIDNKINNYDYIYIGINRLLHRSSENAYERLLTKIELDIL